MKQFVQVCGIALSLAAAGCVPQRTIYLQYTSSHPPPEPAYDAYGRPLSRPELTLEGRMIKRVEIRSVPEGAKIVIGGYLWGETPREVIIPCTASGRFLRTTRVRLLPTLPSQLVCSKIFPSGSKVPSRIEFDTRALPAP